ncbi:MAG: exosome complex protein Rrp42 [Candidatus Micrarchaeota archaeon]
MEILDEIKKDYVRDLLHNGKRADDRKLDEYRSITIERNPLTSAEGSAICRFGKTQVLVSAKVDAVTPFPDRPTEGVLSTNCELLPLAFPTFESGPPSEDSIELARVVDRGIRSSETLDLNSMVIEGSEDKVWGVFLDVYVLDYDGNFFDAAALAAMSSLMSARFPKFEDGKVLHEEPTKPLGPKSKVVTCTIANFGGKKVLDPSYDEEIAAESRLTIATTEDKLCAMQKGKYGSLTKDDVLELIDLSFQKGAELRALL